MISTRPPLSSSKWLKPWFAAAVLFFISASAGVACPLCYELASELMTEGVQLDLADQAVLAVPGAVSDQYRIVAIIKGKDQVGDATSVTGIDAPEAAGSDRYLLIHDGSTQYEVMDVARSRIDPGTVAGWLEDPKLVARRAPYTLLLGFVGRSADADRLEQRLETASSSHDDTNLAAMIGADLELRGPSRVDWVESKYFADRQRTMPEIEAALLALDVQGDANRTIPRHRVIQALRDFIIERRQRRETAEHPFGTLKMRMGATHFLMTACARLQRHPGDEHYGHSAADSRDPSIVKLGEMPRLPSRVV
jgi:hypothetical protein